MKLLEVAGLPVLFAVAAALAAAWIFQARDAAQRQQVWDHLDALRERDPPRYDPAMVAGLPEVAQRYFARAIAPGTPLHRVVRIEMGGRFVMNGKALPMRARQILAPPASGFVWQADIGEGVMALSGSDGYRGPARQGDADLSWTKFWLHGVLPLARMGGSVDHARAAATRVMLEAVWTPAALLPQFGASWRQTGPDSAEVHFAQAPDLPPMHLVLAGDGEVREVWALRWTDANTDKVYRLQPFGGRVLDSGEFQGFRVPVQVEMGNLWGTPAFTPFFLATTNRVEY